MYTIRIISKTGEHSDISGVSKVIVAPGGALLLFNDSSILYGYNADCWQRFYKVTEA